MRHEGKITRWVDKRGFGFIASDDEDSVFLHIKSFETKVRRPYAGDRVTYELAWDKDGRPRAENARFVGEAAAKHKTMKRRPTHHENSAGAGGSVYTPSPSTTYVLRLRRDHSPACPDIRCWGGNTSR